MIFNYGLLWAAAMDKKKLYFLTQRQWQTDVSPDTITGKLK